jgi:hypothetical protein
MEDSSKETLEVQEIHSSLEDTIRFLTNVLLSDLKNITLNSHGSETQVTSKVHERLIKTLIKDAYNCTMLDKDNFRRLLSNNNINYSSNEFKSNPPSYVECVDSSGIESDKNYLVEQPFGSQNYPDLILFTLSEGSDEIDIQYIECKQEKPTWNNTPPKRFDHCLYICGNKAFVGSLICSEEECLLIKNYIDEYTEFVEKFNQNNLNIQFVRYKKIELRKWPTPYFLENEGLNLPLMNETLSRFC